MSANPTPVPSSVFDAVKMHVRELELKVIRSERERDNRREALAAAQAALDRDSAEHAEADAYLRSIYDPNSVPF